ncbi:transcriptional regulator [Paenibacillus faecalis]|uniref:transcriptional regulator n=1 Tax=Paenibacillus faecalis TaxID=2079532 RepID=UPI000D0FEA4F|nr:transcriptional regulator [Paenibacillus faecalis]
MNHTSTIQSELNKYLETNGISINQLSRLSTVNSGTLSALINGERLTSITQFDLIISAMGLPEGSLYREFMDACFKHTVTWRRIGPFLRRCAELRKLDIVEEVVQTLLENLAYSPMLFELAEELFAEGDREATAIIYKNVAEAEKYQHSERLALCHYRLFNLSLGNDLDANFKAAIIFECYVDRLDSEYQLGGLLELAHVYGALHRWDKVEELAQELHRIATIEYEMQSNLKRGGENRKSKHPVYTYILYSHLLRSVAYEERGLYDKALYYTSLYEDTDWIREKNEESERISSQFKEWATANRYLYQLLSGDLHVLDEYVNFVSSKEDQIPAVLFKIVLASNLYNFNIDGILERFAAYVPFKMTSKNKIDEYNKPIVYEQSVRFLIELGKYYIRNDLQGGIEYILKGLELSVKMHCKRGIIKR